MAAVPDQAIPELLVFLRTGNGGCGSVGLPLIGKQVSFEPRLPPASVIVDSTPRSALANLELRPVALCRLRQVASEAMPGKAILGMGYDENRRSLHSATGLILGSTRRLCLSEDILSLSSAQI